MRSGWRGRDKVHKGPKGPQDQLSLVRVVLVVLAVLRSLCPCSGFCAATFNELQVRRLFRFTSLTKVLPPPED
jgi:hypothetical protein